jgi:hypothetical protein
MADLPHDLQRDLLGKVQLALEAVPAPRAVGPRRVPLSTQWRESLGVRGAIADGGQIIRVVAAHYGLDAWDVQHKSFGRAILPRQVAMYLCRELTTLSFPELGTLFSGMHHSTVMYSVQRIKERMENDWELTRTINLLVREIVPSVVPAATPEPEPVSHVESKRDRGSVLLPFAEALA